MALSWNEIKDRALKFSKDWANESNEDAEAKTFLNEFFNVFGISRRRVATFEEKVKILDGKTGFVDMLWKGQILIEMKSRGKNLDRAYKQATDYFSGLKEEELPRYILVCDFQRFRLYDLEEGTQEEFNLSEFHKNVKLFGFIAGYLKKTYKEEDAVNIRAAELMGKLHDELKAVGYTGHQLELYLVRLLFCLFADDTSIFDKNTFQEFIENKTREDGSDTGAMLAQLFEVLNTPENQRMSTMDETLAAFPYVNGKLFEEPLRMAYWNSHMRSLLLKSCTLNWGAISPAIFGSMFQSVMDEKARRNLGAHYTSEKNILKLIKPLFLDELWVDFFNAKNNRKKLEDLHKKIATLKFLDPACGCGNFLVISYRELRLLELEILRTLQKGQQVTNVNHLMRVDVDQFYGIEYEEFPAQIAQVAMWLMDHQMNMQVSEAFGEYYRRLPLRKSARIAHGNALRIDWQGLIDPLPFEKGPQVFNYILGNPPFIGKHLQNAEQKKDMDIVFSNVNNSGVLDYVAAWYLLAAKYLSQYSLGPLRIKVAFVSTNSVSQGEQVGALWSELFVRHHIKIHFAHRTFSWNNEARGNAAVHVVIIGFSNYDVNTKSLFVYEDYFSEPHLLSVSNISPYLIQGNDVVISSRSSPICTVPEMSTGSTPVDEGNFLFTPEEKEAFLNQQPEAKKYFKKIIGSQEFINNIERWCLWLKDISPSELRSLPLVISRVEEVKKFRLKSVKAATREKAKVAFQFAEIRQPDSDYLVIPSVSSERRAYIPIGYINKDTIVSNLCTYLPNASRFSFGVLSSQMHMTWVRYVCGRLESRFRYSTKIVYNNFPWPESPSDKQKQAVESAAQKVLDARAQFPDSSLADLYDPLTMPPALVKAHQELDKAVDLCYRPQPFPSETKRIEFLFELYDKYTSGLFVKEKKKKPKKDKEHESN